MVMKHFFIYRRFFSSVIDIIITFLCSILLVSVLGMFFPYSIPNIGSYIGFIDQPHSEVMKIVANGLYTSFSEYVIGEIWTIVLYVLSLSLPMYLAEAHFSATLGTKLMGGITINDDDSPITKSDALRRFFARVIYYPVIFCVFTHGLDIRPTFAIIFIFIISFIVILKAKRNVIEKLTSTNTFKKSY